MQWIENLTGFSFVDLHHQITKFKAQSLKPSLRKTKLK